MNLQQYINQNPQLRDWLEELPEEILSEIAVRQYAPNDYLITSGRYDHNVYIILEGVCHIARANDAGVVITYYKISTMDVIGLAELHSDRPQRRIANVVAKTEVTAAVIPGEVIMHCLGRYPLFSLRINQQVIQRLHESIGLYAECNNYPLYSSVVTYLKYAYHFYHRQFPPDYTGPVKINESRQEIADIIGVDIRSVNRTVEKLKREGFIKVVRGKIHIDHDEYMNLSNAGAERQ